MNEIYGKAPLNNSAKWGRGGALAIGTMTSQSTPQPITGPLLARAPGLQPRLAQWLMRPWPQVLFSCQNCVFTPSLVYFLAGGKSVELNSQIRQHCHINSYMKRFHKSCMTFQSLLPCHFSRWHFWWDGKTLTCTVWLKGLALSLIQNISLSPFTTADELKTKSKLKTPFTINLLMDGRCFVRRNMRWFHYDWKRR